MPAAERSDERLPDGSRGSDDHYLHDDLPLATAPILSSPAPISQGSPEHNRRNCVHGGMDDVSLQAPTTTQEGGLTDACDSGRTYPGTWRNPLGG